MRRRPAQGGRWWSFVLSLLLVSQPGCSFIFSQGPPPRHETLAHVECSDSAVPPVLDTVAAALLAVSAVRADGEGPSQTSAWLAVGLWAGSAAYGYTRGSQCREATTAVEARWRREQARAALPANAAPRPENRAIAAQNQLAKRAVSDPDPAARREALRMLGRTRNAALSDFVAGVARLDPEPDVRAAAAEAGRALFPFSRRVKMATGLALLPGAGHFYLHEPLQGAAYLTSIVGLFAGALTLANNEDPHDDGAAVLAAITAQNTWFYSTFDAYRRARLARDNAGYREPVSDESLGSLISAPFRPSVLASPWVWAAIPLFLGAGLGLTYLIDREAFADGPALTRAREIEFFGTHHGRGTGFALGELYFGALFTPVAVGEEALFRGFIQPALVESWGRPWGLAGASLLFGAAHIGNYAGSGASFADAAVAIPFITLAGGYMGLVSMRHGNQLARSVAIHFWYDFLLSTVGFVYDPENQPFVARFGGGF